ncbi:MAG TPA: Omp28-related outer membrane protein [Bacteroidia bacterium]|nr:Omp28-related outer membrane protein [Bacteroidia bacterium]
MKKLLLSLMLVSASFGLTKAQTTIYAEDFEGGSVPANWSNITSATDGGWIVGDAATLSSSGFPIVAHTTIAATNDDKCDCDKSNDILSTGTIDLSGQTYVFMSFASYYFHLAYGGVTEEGEVVVSTDGGLTWTSVYTVPGNLSSGWQTDYVNLSAYAGNANVKVGFKYNDNGGWLYGFAIDDVLIYAPQVGTDLSATATIIGKNDPRPVFSAYSKYLTGLPLQIKTSITNFGTTTITSFDYSWSDGVNTNSQSITGVSIAPLSSYEVTASVPYTTLAGGNNIATTVSNINNGTSEISTANNTASFDVEGVTANAERKFFAEEATGTWCQWCPRGAVFMDYMRSTYPNQFVGVAVHNGDPMTITAYDAGMGGLIGGYPSVVPNRMAEIDPSQLEQSFLDLISVAPDAVISGTGTVNSTNNAINIDLSATFNAALSGDYRFMAVVVEDSVTGTGSTYNQSNAYGNNANGPMGGFESFGTTVPAAMMNYDFVNRALLGTFAGQTGSLPATTVPGTPYTYSFTATAGAAWDKSQLSVAAVIINAGTGEVVNAAKFPLTITTGLNDVNNALAGSYVYMTGSDLNLSLQLTKKSDVTINITDVTGKVVLSQQLNSVNKGDKFAWNVASLAEGMYNVTATSADGKVSLKFVK